MLHHPPPPGCFPFLMSTHKARVNSPAAQESGVLTVVSDPSSWAGEPEELEIQG